MASHVTLLTAYQKKRLKRALKITGKRAGLVAVLLAFLLGAGAYLSRIDAMTISSIEIRGNESLTDESLRSRISDQLDGSYALVFPKRNSLIYPKSELNASLIHSFSRLEEVTLHRDGLDRLVVEVAERQPYALWCPSEFRFEEKSFIPDHTCYFMDRTGLIFSSAPHFSDGVFLRFYDRLGRETGDPLGERFLEPEVFQDMNSFVEAVETLEVTPVALERVTEEEFHLHLEEGGSIYISRDDPLERVFHRLAILFQEKRDEFYDDGEWVIEYIDLRFGNRVFFKPKEI